MERGRRPAAFVDKDGTLIEDVPYNTDPRLIQLEPRAAEGVLRLHRAGFAIVVVTNQPGVARGRFPEEALRPVEARLRSILAEQEVPLAGFYYCPHDPRGTVERYAVTCDCRKPRPGLIDRAIGELGLDRERSWLLGDILDDIEAGHLAGVRAVLVDRGNETEWRITEARTPEAIAGDLAEAADFILAGDLAAVPDHLHAGSRGGP